MDILVFIALAACLALNFAGYIYLLFLMQLMRPTQALPTAAALDDPDLPEIHILIATHNEAADIVAKLEDTAALSYPRERMRILVADGGSTDGTPDLVETWAETADIAVQVLRLDPLGKVKQISAALMTIPQSHIVVLTDADARIQSPDALLVTVGLMRDVQGPVLVGGWTEPPQDTPHMAGQMELLYWQKLNRQRHMETESFSASIVVAPYYAFRHSDFQGWPVDCIADDVNISMQYRNMGGRIIYTPAIRVTEQRQPTSLKEMVAHKLRKTNAYALEVLRYSYRLPYLRLRDRFLLAFKIFQFFIMPFATLFFLLWTLYFIIIGKVMLVAAIYTILLVLVIIASFLTNQSPVEEQRVAPRHKQAVMSMAIFLIVLWVLIMNMLIYPGWQQNARYQKVGNRGT